MWQPIEKEVLFNMIEDAEWLMSQQEKSIWDQIKISPMKWSKEPEGDDGGGFWVVALIGQTCVYYNDIEDGFNQSTYTKYGIIDHYSCNQSDLVSFIAWFTNDLRKWL